MLVRGGDGFDRCRTQGHWTGPVGGRLAGSQRPLVVTSAIGVLPGYGLVSEATDPVPPSSEGANPRAASAAAADAVTIIAELSRIEDDIRGRTHEERRAVRQAKSRPIADNLAPWLTEQLARVSHKTKLAEAIRYTLSRWDGLTRFIDEAASRSTPILLSGPPGR